MATFKAVVRTPRKDGFYQVYIRVTQNTKPGYIKTDKIVTKQMVDKHGNINDPFVNEYCARMILLYTDKLNRKDCAKWTVRQIIEYVTQGDADICFSDYARTISTAWWTGTSCARRRTIGRLSDTWSGSTARTKSCSRSLPQRR